MKLSFEQIRSAMSGASDAVESDGAVVFQRMRGELAAFYRREEGSRIRLECASGVRLRFVSDSRTLRLGIRFGAAARGFYKGALLLDAEEQAVFGPDEAVASWQGLALERQRGRRSVFDIWLPHLVRADLLFLELDDRACFEPAPACHGRWLALGDSITQGMTVCKPTDSWVARVALARGLDAYNYGIGGAVMIGAQVKIEHPVECDLVSIAYGTNDLKRGSIGEYASNLRALLGRLASAMPRATLLVITPIPWIGNEHVQENGARLDDFRKTAAEIAAEFPGCRLAHGSELMPADAGLFVDNVHPNEAGMKVFADNLLSCLP